MITPTIQELIDALCLLNNFEKHTIVLGGEQDLKVAVVDRDIKLKTLGVEFNDQYVIETYGIKAEHFKMSTSGAVPNTQFSALPHQAFSFKASVQKQSPEQQEVDELTDAQDQLELLTNEQIKQLAAESETPEALLFNLSRLIPDATKSQFAANLDQALYAADILGYMAASRGE